MADSSKRIAEFRRLHEDGCFAIPNPWDIGSAKFLQSLGFSALATTSAGLAFALGRADTPAALSREHTLDNIREIVEATDLPTNADFQSGYGSTPDDVGESVAMCVATGVAGLSIEDASGVQNTPLFDLPTATDRVRAARETIDESGHAVVLTARAECFLVGHPTPLEESIRRLTAFAEAGADCVYAPGLRTRDEIAAVVSAVAPLPVNVLAADPSWMTMDALADLGVRRVSVGSAFARTAWGAFMTAARGVAAGDFSMLAKAEPFSTFEALFDDA